MEDRYGIRLLVDAPVARDETVIEQIAVLLGVSAADVERVLSSRPGDTAMTAATREEAERMQDAFAIGGVPTRIVALGLEATESKIPISPTQGDDAVPAVPIPGSAAARPSASDERLDDATGSQQRSSSVQRWLSQTDAAQRGSPRGEESGFTITIPAMNRVEMVVVAGAGATIIGLFAPVVRGPLGMGFSFVDGAPFTSLMLFIGCSLVAFLVATRRSAVAVLPLIGVAGFVGIRFVEMSWSMVQFEREVQAIRRDDVFGFTGALLGGVGLAWGWVLLLAGSAAMVYGVTIRLRRRS